MSSSQQQDRSESVVIRELGRILESIGDAYEADAIAYFGPILFDVDDAIRDAVEDIENRKTKLMFILDTGGGYIDVAERIVAVLRKHYAEVEFIVPNMAMSAGTILVMSGDAIHMDYYSRLGPIDPQVQKPNSPNELVPALGYAEKFDELVEKSTKEGLSDAEVSYLVMSFNPAQMYQIEQECELSKTLLKDWLAKYKFKDWNVTEGRQVEVTQEMKHKRAEEIGAALGDNKRWHSHSRGIPMEVLTQELNLRIDDFGENGSTRDAIRSYHKLMSDFELRLNMSAAVHTKEAFTRF